jgi:hypothetical protein
LNAAFPSKDERDVWLEQIKDYKEMANPTNNDVIILMKVRSTLVDAIDALNQHAEIVVADNKHSYQNLAEAQEDRLMEEEEEPGAPDSDYVPPTLAPAEGEGHEEENQAGEQREGEPERSNSLLL